MIMPDRKSKNVKKLQASHRNASQLAINATIWRIIQQNAEEQEDYDPEIGATLTIPKEDLENVPVTFGLKVEQNGDNITITATAKQKSNIILPNKELKL